MADRRRKELPTTVRWDREAEFDLLRHVCRENFWAFFLFAFGAGLNPKGKRWIDPVMHKQLADWFQFHVDDWFAKRQHGVGEQKRLAIILPRECGKTTMITMAGQAWLHLRDPETSSYTGSERIELSMKILDGIKAVMDGSDPFSLFAKLYGSWEAGARKWAGKEIVHSGRKNTARRDPSLGTFAVETSIVGAHPDAWFHDDPISYERMTTDSNWLKTVNSQVSSMEPVVQNDGLIVWPGTRYGDSDHFGVDLAERGVASITGMQTDTLPDADPESGAWHVFFWSARDSQNKPTVPQIWSEKRLSNYQRIDPLRYAAQVLNDPGASEFNPLTREQISQCMVDPDKVPWGSLRYAIMCDTAFSDGERIQGKDETVFIVHGYPRDGSGDVYIVEGHGSNTWRGEDMANRLVATVQRYRRQGRNIFAITDEKTRAGKKGVWATLLQNYFHDVNERMPRFIEFERGSTKKELRLHAATQFWVDGHVRVVRGAPGVDRLCAQMARIGQYTFDKKIKIDWADAHSDAFQEEVYRPMRRYSKMPAPWEAESRMIGIPGLDLEQFRDDDLTSANPRPPIS